VGHRGYFFVAKGTAQVATSITVGNRGATETGSAASRMYSSAKLLSNESSRLKPEVRQFRSTVRAE
jgi:methyl-accepting chemotaxis protein